MVAERFSEPPSTCRFFCLQPPPRAHNMDALGAEQFVPTGVAHDFVPTGMASYEPETVGQSVLMFKMLATGAVTLTQCLFLKWRQYKHQSQMEKERERQQQQQQQQQQLLALGDQQQLLALGDQQQPQQQLLALGNQRFEATVPLPIQGTPGDSNGTPDATTPLGYNYSLLDEQDQAQQHFLQLLAELRTLKQQVREQQQANQNLQLKLVNDNTTLQKLQVGVETRDQMKNEEIRRLQQQLEKQKTTIDDKDKQLQQLNEQTGRTKDPMWEQSKVYNDSWQQDLQRTGRLQVAQDHDKMDIALQTIPVYAMAADMDIAKAIDICVDDYIANGGNIADRNVVNGRVVADWGIRVRIKLEETGISIKDKLSTITITNTNTKGKSAGDGYKTPISTVKRLLYTPSAESSLSVTLVVLIFYDGRRRVVMVMMMMTTTTGLKTDIQKMVTVVDNKTEMVVTGTNPKNLV